MSCNCVELTALHLTCKQSLPETDSCLQVLSALQTQLSAALKSDTTLRLFIRAGLSQQVSWGSHTVLSRWSQISNPASAAAPFEAPGGANAERPVKARFVVISPCSYHLPSSLQLSKVNAVAGVLRALGKIYGQSQPQGEMTQQDM